MKEKDKTILRNDINKFDLFDDLVFLAEVVLRGQKILKDNEFPMDLYEKSKRTTIR